MTEDPTAARRRRQHEQALKRVGGAGTDAGQRLLEQWHREDLDARRRANGKDGDK